MCNNGKLSDIGELLMCLDFVIYQCGGQSLVLVIRFCKMKVILYKSNPVILFYLANTYFIHLENVDVSSKHLSTICRF